MKMTKSGLLAPVVHSNGTSGEALVEALDTAQEAMRTAINALYGCAPNARDYYPLGGGATTIATEEHAARVRACERVRNELNELLEEVQAQIDARQSRRY